MTRVVNGSTTSSRANPPLLHKGCNSANCCSPSKLWRTLQGYIKSNDLSGLQTFLSKDPRKDHILKVALSCRLSNDGAMFPASQQHQLVRLPVSSSTALLGKSCTDLNSLQLALITAQEPLVLALLEHIKTNASKQEVKMFLNHIWGQGNTTLHLAVYLKRLEVVKALLKLGCYCHVVNTRMKNVLDVCQDDQIKQLLLSAVSQTVDSKMVVADKPSSVSSSSCHVVESLDQEQVVTSSDDINVLPHDTSASITTTNAINNNQDNISCREEKEQQQDAVVAEALDDLHKEQQKQQQDHLFAVRNDNDNTTTTTTTITLKQSDHHHYHESSNNNNNIQIPTTTTTNVYNVNYYLFNHQHLLIPMKQKQLTSSIQHKKPPDILSSLVVTSSQLVSCF